MDQSFNYIQNRRERRELHQKLESYRRTALGQIPREMAECLIRLLELERDAADWTRLRGEAAITPASK
jgi:hypothetical protein